ncbi:formylglycine-generating enzyme family protein [Magnetococcales bacterium HHB-1]
MIQKLNQRCHTTTQWIGTYESDTNRVIRGGSWINNARNIRCANRNRNTPENRNNNTGFRLAFAPSTKNRQNLCDYGPINRSIFRPLPPSRTIE